MSEWKAFLQLRFRRLYGHTLLWLHRILPGRDAREHRSEQRRNAIAKRYESPQLVLPNSMAPAERRREAHAFVDRVFSAQALPEHETRVLITLEPAHPRAGDMPREWVARRGEFWNEKLEQVLDVVEATPFETASRLKVVAIAPFASFLAREIAAQGRIVSPFER